MQWQAPVRALYARALLARCPLPPVRVRRLLIVEKLEPFSRGRESPTGEEIPIPELGQVPLAAVTEHGDDGVARAHGTRSTHGGNQVESLLSALHVKLVFM